MFRKSNLMVLISIILLTLILCRIVIYADDNKRLEMGQPAPNFTLNDLNGKSVSLSHFKGKNIIVNFWSINCHGCIEELPVLKEFVRRKSENIILLSISIDKDEEEVKEFLDKNNYKQFTVLLDNTKKVMRQYSIKSIPVFYFVDSDGIVRDMWEGSIEKDGLAKKIKELIE